MEKVYYSSLLGCQHGWYGIVRNYLNLFNNTVYILYQKKQDGCDSDFEKQITVSISVDKRNIIIRISDNGDGILECLMESIFDPFFITRQPNEGAGHDLRMSFEVNKAHVGG